MIGMRFVYEVFNFKDTSNISTRLHYNPDNENNHLLNPLMDKVKDLLEHEVKKIRIYEDEIKRQNIIRFQNINNYPNLSFTQFEKVLNMKRFFQMKKYQMVDGLAISSKGFSKTHFYSIQHLYQDSITEKVITGYHIKNKKGELEFWGNEDLDILLFVYMIFSNINISDKTLTYAYSMEMMKCWFSTGSQSQYERPLWFYLLSLYGHLLEMDEEFLKRYNKRIIQVPEIQKELEEFYQITFLNKLYQYGYLENTIDNDFDFLFLMKKALVLGGHIERDLKEQWHKTYDKIEAELIKTIDDINKKLQWIKGTESRLRFKKVLDSFHLHVEEELQTIKTTFTHLGEDFAIRQRESEIRSLMNKLSFISKSIEDETVQIPKEKFQEKLSLQVNVSWDDFLQKEHFEKPLPVIKDDEVDLSLITRDSVVEFSAFDLKASGNYAKNVEVVLCGYVIHLNGKELNKSFNARLNMNTSKGDKSPSKQAEFNAILKGLEWCIANDYKVVKIHYNRQVIFDLLNKKYLTEDENRFVCKFKAYSKQIKILTKNGSLK